MNKQRASFQQFLIVFVLTWVAMKYVQGYLAPQKTPDKAAVRSALSVTRAFEALPGNSSAPLQAAQAQAEIAQREAEIKTNATDAYSYWARLRIGLIEQYVLKTPAALKDALARFDEVINHGGKDDVEAQAIYQKGDMQWKMADHGLSSKHDAAMTLESLVHQGRGSSQFLNLKIMKPVEITTHATDAPSSFVLTRVEDLHGTLAKPDPQGVLDRVNQYYSTTVFYKIFDALVVGLGSNPTYSYGLALIVFAIGARIVLQPLNKRQYESMKGMQVIAPEMKKIQQKFEKKKDQASQMQMVKEIRELQSRHGVSPMMGCGLALVQLPFFFLVVYPFVLRYEAKMALAHASFLWIPNLTVADYPLLGAYAVSQFVSMRLSSTPATDAQQRQMQQMMMFFPFVMPFFLLTWPSAFTMFWMTFNIVSTYFQYRMMKSADPSKQFFKSVIYGPGEALPAAAGTVEVIPARPKGTVKSLVPPIDGGSHPGTANGVVKSAGPGAAATPAAVNVISKKEARERRRKR